MNTTYADTAFVCSTIAADANSSRATAWMNAWQGSLPWTWLHELEFRNAIRLQVFQGRIDASTRDRIVQLYEADRQAGVYEWETPPPAAVSAEAERLSAAHTARLGTRSLDVLHVAQAVVLGARDFLTFDKRQAELAKAAGLRVPKL